MNTLSEVKALAEQEQLPARPITILIAALGGEGGGVLADWLVAAATAQGFPVQSTSIPGVAQRTGATTYYVEIYPATVERLHGRRPVLALTPAPGNIDVMVASELLEAGRAMQNGYVSPDRTTLIASTHRIYATLEKMAMADGRFDSDRLSAAAAALARRAVLFDMPELARASGTVINAVLFGAMAGSGALPLTRDACEGAIRATGKGAEASLRGFAAGYAHAAGAATQAETHASRAPGKIWRGRPVDRVRRELPAETHRIVEEGVARLADYQDRAYADLYLDRVARVVNAERDGGGGALGYRVANETARYLALWMSYEDVIRVADLKSRRSRFERVRAEVMAKHEEPVRIVEFLKPGMEEFTALLPPALARRLLAWAARRGKSFHRGVYVKTTSISGFLMLRLLAALRPLRRSTSRYVEEQQLIERWLQAVIAASARDLALAGEVAQLGRLIKGYGDTLRRGRGNFLRIMETLLETGQGDAGAVRAAREAALADPEGRQLEGSLASLGIAPLPPRSKPIRFQKRPTRTR
ncbi:MAG TPA: indolepyruvate oxidoreductase subunit beta family protein [Burkholderiaceae bacterium]|nr:indolepyruvate oxidoreductase subunit beta family protein [Burkholderiaceae bacterium]